MIAGAGLYIITTGMSAWAFGAFGGTSGSGTISPLSQNAADTNGLHIDPSEPKDKPCPLNGQLYTNTEKAAWEQQRPVFAMIENHVDARPQSGLSRSDIVYEAIAEGGITRFGAVFYCQAVARPGKIAPVRSARIYFVQLAQEYNTPIYIHVGGGNCSRDEASGECTSDKRAWALEELAKIGWRKPKGNDFDTLGDIGKPVLYRDANRLGADHDLAVEHTMVGSLAEVWKEATKRGFTGHNADNSTWASGLGLWKFKDGATLDARGNVAKISFDFWSGYSDYSVRWEYDRENNIYKRFTGDQPHIDLENNEQLSTSSVVIEFTKEEGPIDDHKHMLYQVIGKGKALIFQNGQTTDATWEKKDAKSRTVYRDAKTNQEISFVRGRVWVEVVPADNTIAY